MRQLRCNLVYYSSLGRITASWSMSSIPFSHVFTCLRHRLRIMCCTDSIEWFISINIIASSSSCRSSRRIRHERVQDPSMSAGNVMGRRNSQWWLKIRAQTTLSSGKIWQFPAKWEQNRLVPTLSLHSTSMGETWEDRTDECLPPKHQICGMKKTEFSVCVCVQLQQDLLMWWPR